MTDREKELTNRYIYEVTKRVPKAQREEIEMELQELIADMGKSLPLDQVFLKLGDPAVFAKQYREDKNYIISPDYFDDFMWVMKIVMLCVWGGMLIATVIRCATDYQEIPMILLGFVSEVILASVAAFGSVTLIFAILERQKIKLDLKMEKVWNPDMLSPIPEKKARISRGDCVLNLIFIILFSCLLIFAPYHIGFYSAEGDEIIFAALFNLDKWDVLLPVFLFSMAAGLIDEIIRLVIGCYCRIVMISSIAANVIQIAAGVLLLKILPFWNIDFVKEVTEKFSETLRWKNQFIEWWDPALLSNIILAIIVAASLLEIGNTIYKTMRYGRRQGL